MAIVSLIDNAVGAIQVAMRTSSRTMINSYMRQFETCMLASYCCARLSFNAYRHKDLMRFF